MHFPKFEKILKLTRSLKLATQSLVQPFLKSHMTLFSPAQKVQENFSFKRETGTKTLYSEIRNNITNEWLIDIKACVNHKHIYTVN